MSLTLSPDDMAQLWLRFPELSQDGALSLSLVKTRHVADTPTRRHFIWQGMRDGPFLMTGENIRVACFFWMVFENGSMLETSDSVFEAIILCRMDLDKYLERISNVSVAGPRRLHRPCKDLGAMPPMPPRKRRLRARRKQ